jgi:hypothetical protein
MLNALIANGELEDLKELFNIYDTVNEEKEVLRIAGKIIQRCLKINKDDLIAVLDKCHEIIFKYRDDLSNLINLHEDLNKSGKIKF